jgi:hypothetical protein
MAVKGAPLLRVHRSEAKTLDGHRSGGYGAAARKSPIQHDFQRTTTTKDDFPS